MAEPVTPDDLRSFVKEFVAAYPAETGVRDWWREPLLATARADLRFEALPYIAAPNHVLPYDLLPSARTVIVFFIPFVRELAEENAEGKFPCRNWGRAYVDTNELIGRLCKAIESYLRQRGYESALTPATHNFDKSTLTSRWSHKHLSHLVGLGRFGHNSQLITPAGCVGRLGSLVTSAELGDSPLTNAKAACLHKAGRECLECVTRCPVGALSAEGLDRSRCWQRLLVNQARRSEMVGLPETTHVCAKCAMILPCSFTDPVAETGG